MTPLENCLQNTSTPNYEDPEQKGETKTKPQKRPNRDSSKPSPNSSLNRLDILVLGQAGSGKSSTGNSLLLRRAFETSNSSSYGNLDIQSAWSDYRTDNGKLYRIKVTDGASPEDIDPTKKPKENKACENIAKLVTECPRGFHVIVITVRLGVLFTDEYTILEKQFARDCLDKHGVVVITGADGLIDDDLDDEKRASCFKEWCDRQTGNLKRCFEKCKGRIVLFDNNTKDPSLRKKQLERFLSGVDELAEKDTRYTTGLFSVIEKELKKLVKQPTVSEEIRGHISAIQGKIVNIGPEKPLEEIREDLESLLELLKVDEAKSKVGSTCVDVSNGQNVKKNKVADKSDSSRSETQKDAAQVSTTGGDGAGGQVVEKTKLADKSDSSKSEPQLVESAQVSSTGGDGADGHDVSPVSKLIKSTQYLLNNLTAEDKEKARQQCINDMVKTAALQQNPELYETLGEKVRAELSRKKIWVFYDNCRSKLRLSENCNIS